MRVPAIPPRDAAAEAAARRRWDTLTKPPGSLGRLETLATQIAGMTGRPQPAIARKVIVTAAGDHGVVAEGVAAYPQAVTAQMVANFLRGGAAINVLARQVGAEVLVVDAGVASALPVKDGLIQGKVRAGTGNMAREPAMTRQEAERCVAAGIEVFRNAQAQSPIGIVGLGDMGIGNTTPSAALVALFTNAPVAQVTGHGTGLTEPQRHHKVRVIEHALARHRPDPRDPIGCLAAVGGLEIGCLAGVALAAASARVPVMLDGFIATAAALLAARLAPPVTDYCIASHQSIEPGHRVALQALGLTPLLDLELRLGEGTGAALGIFLVEASVNLLTQMATFAEAGVSEKAS